MVSKFTPGPWEITESRFEGSIYITSPKDSDIAKLLGSDADGALIALAPEMHGALLDAFDALTCNLDEDEWPGVAFTIRELLSRATGSGGSDGE